MSLDDSVTAGPEPQAEYVELSSLAYTDPLAARERFFALLQNYPHVAMTVLNAADAPRDARLRQVVARAIVKRPERDLLVDVLERWREVEMDEFTLVAIKDALVTHRETLPRRSPDPLVDLPGTYRYVTSRLRHRILNALPRPGVIAQKLQMEARRSSEPEVYARMGPMLDELLSTLRRVEALADFEEHACHFDPMGVRLRAWLNDHQVRFSKEFGPVELRTDFSSCGDDVIIYATTFWLDLVFTNLMKNSLEATGFPCRILVRAIADPKRVRLVIIDNGLGLASEDQNRAFTVQYSSKGTDRGRGHMEIGDAMRRMGGGARVDMVPDHGYRVHLTFRREVM